MAGFDWGEGASSAIKSIGDANDVARATYAYNALNKAYGPAIAGNPLAAQQAASAEEATANLPNVEAAQTVKANALTKSVQDFGASAGNPEAQQQNLANQDTANQAQRYAKVRALHMLGASADDKGNIDPATVDKLVGPNAQALGFQTPEQYAQFRDQVTQPGAAANIPNQISSFMQPQTVVGAKPIVYGQDGKAYQVQTTKDGQTAMVPLGGVAQASVVNNQANLPTKQFNAQTARIAATNPKAVVIDASGNANLVGGGKVTPTTLNTIQGPQGTAAKAAATVEGKAAGTNAANMQPQNVAIARADLGQMDLQYQRTNDVLDKMATQVGPLTTGYGGRVSEFLGTTNRAALDASLQTAKSNIALLTANMARNGSKSVPVAVRNLQEFKAYQDALGAINPNASADVVRQQIQTAKTNLQALQAGVHAKYQATYGDAVLPSNAPAPAPTGTWGNLRVSQ